MDMSCFVCGGTRPRCQGLHGAGGSRLLGAGMVEPRRAREVGYDPEEYPGSLRDGP